ncbi:pre-mRNA-splicing factor 18-like isoform X2 [Physella acuta]|uniref:pre-mRNA-splicing factor 18-like isoform X2 n=1 Tax=Physella acuta TaxID=109671 RepID=UPI0027DABEAB|nr:pre-mRNA-splicing factor 18-like isoform X2 [Physella acuta]
MDVLKAEIERKKRQLEESSLIKNPKQKYFKRADLASKQAEEYWKKSSNVVKSEYVSQNEGIVPAVSNVDGKTDRQAQLPRKEVVRKLRERGEPIRLFGEDDFDAYKRLKKLETSEPDIKGEGYSNDFQAAMEKVDEDYLNEIIKSTGKEEVNTSNDVSVKDDGTTQEDINRMRQELGQGDKDKDHEIVLRFFKFVLKKWGEQLNTRPEEEKRTIKGKVASATHSQTVAYLKPLFRKLKYKDIDEGLLESIVEIVQYMMDKNYIKANDSYLEMAIGNAPWPIGVTMVGIHARTGREKISSRYVAHVLNDETQRKYIQAVKRLMTQCQNLFPTDPSRSYNFLRTSSS